MKPFLVHVHVYYDYLWEELFQCLKNISDYNYELHVTLVKDDSKLINRIKSEFNSASIHVVPNLGFDIGPFIDIIRTVNLSNYSYVIKIHTKRDIQRIDSLFWFYGARWRNALLKFIKSSSNFNAVIQKLENNPEIGMHGDKITLFNKYCDDNKAQKATLNFLRNNSLESCNYSFVAGAMFVVRANLLQRIKDLNLAQKDFQYADQTHNNCQLAHIVERLFGYAVCSQNFKIADCTSSVFVSKIVLFLNAIRKFVFTSILSFRVTSKNKFLVKLLYIPVLAIPLKKRK